MKVKNSLLRKAKEVVQLKKNIVSKDV